MWLVFHEAAVFMLLPMCAKKACVASWKASGIVLRISFGIPSGPAALLFLDPPEVVIVYIPGVSPHQGSLLFAIFSFIGFVHFPIGLSRTASGVAGIVAVWTFVKCAVAASLKSAAIAEVFPSGVLTSDSVCFGLPCSRIWRCATLLLVSIIFLHFSRRSPFCFVWLFRTTRLPFALAFCTSPFVRYPRFECFLLLQHVAQLFCHSLHLCIVIESGAVVSVMWGIRVSPCYVCRKFLQSLRGGHVPFVVGLFGLGIHGALPFPCSPFASVWRPHMCFTTYIVCCPIVFIITSAYVISSSTGVPSVITIFPRC